MTKDKLYLILTFILIGILPMVANIAPKPKVPHRFVNDYTKLFTKSQADSLEYLLNNLNGGSIKDDLEHSKIFVVAVQSLLENTSEKFAGIISDEWDDIISDNDIIILVKPKTKKSNGEIYIRTEYFASSKLSDQEAGDILDSSVLPFFKKQDYYGGVKAAILAIDAKLTYVPPAPTQNEASKDSLWDTNAFLGLFIMIAPPFIILFFIIYNHRKKVILRRRIKQIAELDEAAKAKAKKAREEAEITKRQVQVTSVSAPRPKTATIKLVNVYVEGMPLIGKSYIVLRKKVRARSSYYTSAKTYQGHPNIVYVEGMPLVGNSYIVLRKTKDKPNISNNAFVQTNTQRSSTQDRNNISSANNLNNIYQIQQRQAQREEAQRDWEWRQERERREREEQDRRDREYREEQDRRDRERRDREQRDREERERRDRDRREQEQRDRDERERRQRESDNRSNNDLSGGSGRSFGSGGGSGRNFGDGGGSGRSW